MGRQLATRHGRPRHLHGGVNSAIGSNFADVYDAHRFSTDGTFNSFQGKAATTPSPATATRRSSMAMRPPGVTITWCRRPGTATGDASVGTDTFTGGVNSVLQAPQPCRHHHWQQHGTEVFIGNAVLIILFSQPISATIQYQRFFDWFNDTCLTFSSPFTPGSETSFQAWATSRRCHSTRYGYPHHIRCSGYQPREY